MGKKLALGIGALFGLSLVASAEKKERKKREEEQTRAIEAHNAEIAAQKEKSEDIARYNRLLKEAKRGVERAEANYAKRQDPDWLEIKSEYEEEILIYEAELERLAS